MRFRYLSLAFFFFACGNAPAQKNVELPRENESRPVPVAPAVVVADDVPMPQASIGVSRGVNQEVEYLDCKITVTAIEGEGKNQVVRYRVTEKNGKAADYVAWPSRASHTRPQPSPSGHVLVHITSVTSGSAALHLLSAAAVDPDGIYLEAKDGETIHYAGLAITSRDTRTRRTMDGGHATTTRLDVEEDGKVGQIHLSTSMGESNRSHYEYSPGRAIKIAMVNGDRGRGSYHVVAEGGDMPTKNISELKTERLGDEGTPRNDRESPHRIAVHFLGSSVKDNFLTASVELVNAGPATQIVLFPVTESGLLLQLPDETVHPRAGGLPPPGPPAPLKVQIPARHRIVANMQIDLGDYQLSGAQKLRLAWSFMLWNQPRPNGTHFVPRQ